MTPYLIILILVQVALSAAVPPTPESPHLEARKVAAQLMVFPIASCSSSGRVESIISDRCTSLRTIRAKGLVVREVTSNCRGECPRGPNNVNGCVVG